MLLCQLQPTYQTPGSPDDKVNWGEAASQLPQPELLSCPNWIRTKKEQTNTSKPVVAVNKHLSIKPMTLVYNKLIVFHP